MLAWSSVWSKVQTCIWPSHCHSPSLASVKSRLFLPFCYRLTRVVPERGLLNMCVYIMLYLDQTWILFNLFFSFWLVKSKCDVICVAVCSAYESSTETGSALLNSSGIRAVWMLMLALLFKMASTIFTYGIKVPVADMLKFFSCSILCSLYTGYFHVCVGLYVFSRLRRSAYYKMGPVVTRVAWSVFVCVCVCMSVGQTWAVPKWLNWLKCHSVCVDLWCPRNRILDGGSDPHGKGKFWE